MTEAEIPMVLVPDAVDLGVLESLADAQVDGESDLVVELIDLFLADAPARVVIMREAMADSDARLLGRAAHALKGSSSTLGAVQVAESCAELEQLARDGSLQHVAPVLDRLDQELAYLQTTFLIERQKRQRWTN